MTAYAVGKQFLVKTVVKIQTILLKNSAMVQTVFGGDKDYKPQVANGMVEANCCLELVNKPCFIAL